MRSARCSNGRREWLCGALASLAAALPGGAVAAERRAADAEKEAAKAEAAIRAGGVVVAMRHALAPGVYDPPGFRLGDCATQRNLNDEGRRQARRVGAWFRARSLRPAGVLASPWCRCTDTATLAFGSATVWPALGSPADRPLADAAADMRELEQALAAATSRPGRFEVWVTHQFVLSRLAGSDVGSAEALVLAVDPADGRVRRIAGLTTW